MALTLAEQTALRTIITRDGGLQNVIAEIQAMAIGDTKSAGLAALSPAISVAVTNWPAIAAYVGGATNLTLYSVMADITAAAAAQNAANLGPLFVALYAAVKANYGL